MKKSILLVAGLAAMFGFTSCSSDEFEGPSGSGDAMVQFNLGLPSQINTRSFGDGTTATSLSYAVYDVTDATSTDGSDWTEVYLENDAATFQGLQTSVNINLVVGRTYTFVFWADCGASSPYTFEGKSIAVSYTDVVSNLEDRDAFYQIVEKRKVTASFTESATLYRPFAQINLGTSDLQQEIVQNAYGTNLTTSLKVRVPSSLNLIDGSVPEQDTWRNVTFAAAAAPEGETFPVEGYDYLNMNYLLMPKDQAIVDVEYKIYNAGTLAKTLSVPNVPLRRNYRTNIYGALLTASGVFNIDIEPAFETPDENIGLSVKELLDAAANGGEVILMEDINLTTDLIYVTSTLKVNLNGHNITAGEADASKVKCAFLVGENGNLTIDGDGVVDGGSGSASNVAVWAQNGGVVVINGGTYTVGPDCDGAGNSTIYSINGDITINGGTFTNTIEGDKTFILNVGQTQGGTGKITIYGGYFVGRDPADGDDNLGGTFVADGYVSVVSSQDPLTYTVIEKFGDYENYENVADGVVKVSDTEFLLIDGEGLANIETFVQQSSGKTFYLTNDIDLADFGEWKPIAQSGGYFQGTFDGQGHTISNLTLQTIYSYGTGMFGNLSGGAAIKNVTLEEPYVFCGRFSGNIKGVVSGYAYGDVLFEDIHIVGGDISGYGKVGGILGMAADPSGVTTLRNCSVDGISIYSVYNSGGLIGLAQNLVELENCTVENVYWAGQTYYPDEYVEIDQTITGHDGNDLYVKGTYWKYGKWRYAAWGDYYTDYYQATTTDETALVLDEENGILLADGLCHNK